MAEFCLACWNELNHSKLTKKDVVLTKRPELCEGCAQRKPVVVRYRRKWLRRLILGRHMDGY